MNIVSEELESALDVADLLIERIEFDVDLTVRLELHVHRILDEAVVADDHIRSINGALRARLAVDAVVNVGVGQPDLVRRQADALDALVLVDVPA